VWCGGSGADLKRLRGVRAQRDGAWQCYARKLSGVRPPAAPPPPMSESAQPCSGIASACREKGGAFWCGWPSGSRNSRSNRRRARQWRHGGARATLQATALARPRCPSRPPRPSRGPAALDHRISSYRPGLLASRRIRTGPGAMNPAGSLQ
jgi:hypothetical protein